MSSEHEELVKRIAALEAELAQLKSELPPPRKEFVPRAPIPRFDPTENFRLPADAAHEMAKVVKDPPKDKGFNAHAWAQTKIGSPGGFGPADKRGWQTGAAKVRPEEKLEVPKPPWSGWSK